MTTSISGFLHSAHEALANHSPSPRIDAEALVMYVCGLTRAQLITRAQDALTPEQESQLRERLARRARGEPIAYLTGRREFWSLELHVTPAVLIPRPDTELLVEQALTHIPVDAELTVADLGTGSGAVALAIASERPRARVIATDISEEALAVARTNAERLGIHNVEFRHGDWLSPLAGLRVDVIVSNPPYIAGSDPHLTEGDLRFEPRAALTPGVEGLEAIRRLACEAPAHLAPGGWLLVEHGFDQGTAVRDIFSAAGFRRVTCHRDIAGLDRMTEGSR
ncbi:MAG: peptide chain release factor N(5)-glutamine methyltransferase [Gammaproteobacteria bacterium]|nr:peptide chain release factor N(5)-glutamine methyltransferase [Gammaproteobacteria bacterium]